MGEKWGLLDVEFEKLRRDFFFKEPADFYVKITALPIRSEKILALKMLFLENVQATGNLASLPFLMASSAAQKSRFVRITLAERIRARSHDVDEAEKDRIASDVANRKFAELINTDEGINAIVTASLADLKQAASNEDFQRSADELMREAIVMIWGAFESLASDLFRLVANERPDLAIKVAQENQVIFPKTLSLDMLAEQKFDFSKCMGDVILRERGLDSLVAIKAAFKTLAGQDARLMKLLGRDELWRLWQRRHLIVHRRGLVDETYVRKAGDNGAVVGRRLLVSSYDLDEAMEEIRDIGSALIELGDQILQ